MIANQNYLTFKKNILIQINKWHCDRYMCTYAYATRDANGIQKWKPGHSYLDQYLNKNYFKFRNKF